MVISYVHGVGPAPLSGATLGEVLEQTARRAPDGEALVVPHQGVRWTWSELSRRVDDLAAGLLALGLGPGERVGIWAPNCAEWILVQFATARIGLILVNLNPAYRVPELEDALVRTGCRALVTALRVKTSDHLEMLAELCPRLLTGPRPRDTRPLDAGASAPSRAERLPDLAWVLTLGPTGFPGALDLAELPGRATPADQAAVRSVAGTLQFDDPLNIQFTSGTTGHPKAATLTHHNIVNNARAVAATLGFGQGDRLCIPVPMYHCFGMVLGSLVCAVSGATMVFPSETFDAGSMLRTLEAERCTGVHGVPTMFIAALEHEDFPAADLRTLRTGVIAGAPCPVELMQRLVGEMHLEQITIAYGMTETGPVSFQTSRDDTLERRVSTVGRVLPHTEVKIVDEEGRVVPRGTTGELLTRGHCVMRGYWGDEAATAEAIDAAGWARSGDLAVLDEDGYGRIVGRVKDMVIRGGENIYPREIEEFLYTHPAVEEVEVFGVPDPRYGEEVCAWVKLRAGAELTADELRAFCRGHLAHFKIPRHVRFVEAFPMTVTGKVQKRVLRQRMIEILDGPPLEQAVPS